MKFIATVISTVVVGLIVASSKPFAEFQQLVTNKKRLVYSAIFGLTAFVFVMAGIISGAIEAALQFEVQGFVFWSALMTVSAAFLGCGVMFAVIAKLTLPSFAPPPSPFGELEKHFHVSELIEGIISKVLENAQTAAAPAERHSETAQASASDFKPSHSPNPSSEFMNH